MVAKALAPTRVQRQMQDGRFQTPVASPPPQPLTGAALRAMPPRIPVIAAPLAVRMRRPVFGGWGPQAGGAGRKGPSPLDRSISPGPVAKVAPNPRPESPTRPLPRGLGRFAWPGDGNSRSGPEVSAPLEAALAASQGQAPFVLVGHSLGALYVPDFARRHPRQVKGIVQVDPRLAGVIAASLADGATAPAPFLRKRFILRPGPQAGPDDGQRR